MKNKEEIDELEKLRLRIIVEQFIRNYVEKEDIYLMLN
jgi:hypothetical protein